MITWWHIALLLMTLSRVASFAISRRKNSCCKDADKEDLISQLPDDILASIIARIPTKFAVSTSTLSKRWRNLYKSVSNICLRCEDLLQYYAHAPHSSNSGEILFKLERFFQLYSSGSKIHCVNVQCCITKSYADRLEQCIYSLGKLGIETLYLGLSCCSSPSDLSFSCHLLSKMPSLKSLFLFACPLQPILNSHCNSSLQTIELRVVTILPGSLECILSNCLRLHSLYIGRCLSPSKLCFCGPNLQLETLIIESCQGAETIEIYASNLLTLEFRNHKIVNFIFHHVPQLRTFYFAPRSQNVMSHVFGRLAKDLPLLESLTFETKGDFYQESARLMRMGIETFSNLRRLDLLVYCTPKTNLLELSPFLLSCPLLQEFHLAASNLGYDGPKQSKAVVLHSELKKVQIIGFDGTENEIEFLLYIIRSAVSLEKMVISKCGKYYKGYGRWQRLRTSRGSEEAYEAIQKQLQDQALSKTAQVIVQYTS